MFQWIQISALSLLAAYYVAPSFPYEVKNSTTAGVSFKKEFSQAKSNYLLNPSLDAAIELAKVYMHQGDPLFDRSAISILLRHVNDSKNPEFGVLLSALYASLNNFIESKMYLTRVEENCKNQPCNMDLFARLEALKKIIAINETTEESNRHLIKQRIDSVLHIASPHSSS